MMGRMGELRSSRRVLRSAASEFQRDNATDLAAALTYYAVLAVFPGLLAVMSLISILGDGPSTTRAILDLLVDLGQRDAAEQLREPIEQMVETKAAGFALVFGLLGALWSASGYIGAFGRAMNRVYDVDEGRPFWKLRPLNLALTVLIVVLAAIVLAGFVVSGPFAEQLGERLGVGEVAVTAWNYGKWPVLLLIVVVIVALLYSATPNVRQPSFRWISVGAAVAIAVWMLASLGFGLYVTNFGSYNQTYGTLAGVIVFLLWLWLTNVALLFGAEVDAELERSRELRAGIEAEETLQLPPRDTQASAKQAVKLAQRVADGRALRVQAARADETPATSAPPAAPAESVSLGGRPSSESERESSTSARHAVAGVAAVGLLTLVVNALAGLFGVRRGP